RKPMGEWLHRELQCSPARRTPRRRDRLHAQRGKDHRGKLASALQDRASAWIARLQAAGAGGLHPGIRAGGPATPTSDDARAGATTIIALTIKLDPSVGADQIRRSGLRKPGVQLLWERLRAPAAQAARRVHRLQGYYHQAVQDASGFPRVGEDGARVASRHRDVQWLGKGKG